MNVTRALLFFILLVSGSCATAPPQEKPYFVIDNAELLLEKQVIDLTNLYLSHHQKTSGKIGLLIVRNYAPEKDLRSFSRKYFADHGFDDDSTHCSSLMVFCTECQAVQLLGNEVAGRRVTDAIARAIIDTVMVPSFRRGRDYEGILNGSSAIMALLEQSPVNKQL